MSPQLWLLAAKGLGVLLLMGGLWMGVLYVRDLIQAPVKAELAQVKQDLADKQKDVNACNSLVQAQTKAVQELKAEADRRLEKSKAELAKAKKQAEKHRETALDILAAKPEVPDGLCESARRVLIK